MRKSKVNLTGSEASHARAIARSRARALPTRLSACRAAPGSPLALHRPQARFSRSADRSLATADPLSADFSFLALTGSDFCTAWFRRSLVVLSILSGGQSVGMKEGLTNLQIV